jgi:hypothetical protein
MIINNIYFIDRSGRNQPAPSLIRSTNIAFMMSRKRAFLTCHDGIDLQENLFGVGK